ncbi:hypothetical protein [Streptomyces spongiae]|uniref:Uncharacterized protein n=1 Tax=Streptomyces spongiae TaxID=565072 RepID=A0A5N8XCC2_9ACTN|nr:hypothetical protein [Streptomyces spongiae]MPY57160.1 hypothetical protein [Streptomyces spongiae]
MFERIYTTTDPVAVVAAAALCTMREAARIPDEDEVSDADGLFTFPEAVRFCEHRHRPRRVSSSLVGV